MRGRYECGACQSQPHEGLASDSSPLGSHLGGQVHEQSILCWMLGAVVLGLLAGNGMARAEGDWFGGGWQAVYADRRGVSGATGQPVKAQGGDKARRWLSHERRVS